MENNFSSYRLADLAKAVRFEEGKNTTNAELAKQCKVMIEYVSKSVYVETEARLYEPGVAVIVAGNEYDDVMRYAKRMR